MEHGVDLAVRALAQLGPLEVVPGFIETGYSRAELIFIPFQPSFFSKTSSLFFLGLRRFLERFSSLERMEMEGTPRATGLSTSSPNTHQNHDFPVEFPVELNKKKNGPGHLSMRRVCCRYTLSFTRAKGRPTRESAIEQRTRSGLLQTWVSRSSEEQPEHCSLVHSA